MNQLLQGRGITVKSPTVKDPDAMDVDRVQLSKNQRTEYLKEGKWALKSDGGKEREEFNNS